MITNYDKCIICDHPLVNEHHLIFGTANRPLADEDGLTVPLCPRHHNLNNMCSVHLNGAIVMWSKICGQLAYELDRVAEGHTKEEARDSFRQRYGRSYL